MASRNSKTSGAGMGRSSAAGKGGKAGSKNSKVQSERASASRGSISKRNSQGEKKSGSSKAST